MAATDRIGAALSSHIDGSLDGRSIAQAERATMATALAAEGLPTDDLDDPRHRFFAFDRAGERVGYGGLELHGEVALLRSLVTLPAARGFGVGAAMVEWLAAHARGQDACSLYLLTMGAADYFARHGFARIERASAPPAIAATAQFSALCPASAVVMRRDLG